MRIVHGKIARMSDNRSEIAPLETPSITEEGERFEVADAIETSPMWGMIAEVALSEGVELFDIEYPKDGGASKRSGVVRVYITKAVSANDAGGEEPVERRGGVTFEDCVRVARRLLDIDEQKSFVPESCVLEVSSPGVNRSLRLPAHFQAAVGERIRIKFRSLEGVYKVILGVLRSFADGALEIEVEEKRSTDRLIVPLNEVKEARIDFKF